MEQRKFFKTGDLYLSAALSILLNRNPLFEVTNEKTFFLFPQDDETYRCIALYNSGIEINAFEFAEKIRRLRGEMIARRKGG
jgi:hypothetical protein